MISLADMITIGNFICGLLAIMFAFERGDGFRVAMLLILFGSILDGLDGPAARRWGSSHKFGKWLDSIADSMTFCIAPSLLVYNMFFDFQTNVLSSFQNVLVVVASLSIVILGILRLARFSLTGFRWKDFVGLPTPAMAIVVVSFGSFGFFGDKAGLEIPGITAGVPFLIPTLLLVFSWTMIFDVKYRKPRGKGMIIGGLALLFMMFCLIMGRWYPGIGLIGGATFTLASLIYLFSPLGERSEGIWGASRRFRDEELIELEGLNEGVQEEDYRVD